MTKETTVAARYAHALFLVTEKRGETARALEDLKGLATLLRPDQPVGRLLATPRVLLSDKRKTVLQVLEGQCLRAVALFVDLLLRKHRLAEFATIVSEFAELVESAQGVRRARVTSAVPLTDGERDQIHARLESATGKKIQLTAEVDTRLVGGALARIGDRVVDRSVRSLLDAIERQLLEARV